MYHKSFSERALEGVTGESLAVVCRSHMLLKLHLCLNAPPATLSS
jgi:hypothetical protein